MKKNVTYKAWIAKPTCETAIVGRKKYFYNGVDEKDKDVSKQTFKSLEDAQEWILTKFERWTYRDGQICKSRKVIKITPNYNFDIFAKGAKLAVLNGYNGVLVVGGVNISRKL